MYLFLSLFNSTLADISCRLSNLYGKYWRYEFMFLRISLKNYYFYWLWNCPLIVVYSVLILNFCRYLCVLWPFFANFKIIQSNRDDLTIYNDYFASWSTYHIKSIFACKSVQKAFEHEVNCKLQISTILTKKWKFGQKLYDLSCECRPKDATIPFYTD